MWLRHESPTIRAMDHMTGTGDPSMIPPISLRAALATLALAGFVAAATAEAPSAPSSAGTGSAPTPAVQTNGDGDLKTGMTRTTSSATSGTERLDWLPGGTMLCVGLVFVLGAGGAVATLRRDPNWSIAGALSEKDPNAATAQPVPAVAPGEPAANPANQAPVPSPSTSRLIAFFGMIAMLAFFIGFGSYLLWALFTDRGTQAKDAFDAVKSYLLYGTALYAPYALNQVSSAFKG
jgi:hypothetical protein